MDTNFFSENGYVVLNLKQYLSNEDLISYIDLLNKFELNLDNIKSDVNFLRINFDISTFDIIDSDFIKELHNKKYVTYSDYLKLVEINKKYNIDKLGYFNFMLTSSQRIDDIKYYTNKVYKKILKEFYNLDIPENVNTLNGHMNVYPKHSFINKHVDGISDAILSTTIFFLNTGRKYEDGSILVVYDKNGKKIEILPDYTNIVILNHTNINLEHEVTENLVDDIRLSLYNPLDKNYIYNPLVFNYL